MTTGGDMANSVRSALAELVACKALQDAADAIHDGPATAEQWGDKLRMIAEYERRQPLAWAASRAALAQKSAPADDLVREALLKLANEAEGLAGAYPLADYIGNTNVAVLKLRIDEARAALARDAGAAPREPTQEGQ